MNTNLTNHTSQSVRHLVFKGTRGQMGLNEQKYAEIIVKLSTLLRFATEIKKIDINPLLADEQSVTAVDARIRIERPLIR